MNRTCTLLLLPLTLLWAAVGCNGDKGAPEEHEGHEATDGTDAADGTDGTDGTDGSDGGGDCYTLADGSCVAETFANPPRLEPDGDGVYTLTFGAAEVTLAGQRHCVRAYNGQFPAPTLDIPARDGDTPRQVRVDLKNTFTKSDFRTLSGDSCICTDSMGHECEPMAHGACDDPDMEHSCTCVDADGDVCEHLVDQNLTNLHAHGSHVRPDYATGGGCTEADGMICRECGEEQCDGDATDNTCFLADDVLTSVPVGTGARYRWDIDEDGTHHEGLNWFHPHIHGSTAIQTGAGAAGAWIIRGAVDSLDVVAQATERVMVFQTPSIAENGFTPLADGVACTEDTITFNDFSVLSATTSPQLNLINGARQPRLVTSPGQTERWRILNAAFLDEVWLGAFRGADKDCSSWSLAAGDALPLQQIGRDGIVLPQPFSTDFAFLSSGYRLEALVGGEGVFQHGDTWCLVSGRYLQSDGEESPTGEPVSPRTLPTEADIRALLQAGDLVAIVNVTEDKGPATETRTLDAGALSAIAKPTTIDGVSAEDRCAAAAALSDPATIDQVAVLQVGIFTFDDPDPCGCDDYNINCNNFEEVDRSRYPFDRDLPLNAVEHWRVGASIDGHPFHIHINPFVVCPNDNPFDPIPFPHWRDTYLVNLDRKVDLITQYSAFTGAFVTHCHKLTHEDHGMMQLLRVCDPATDPTCGDNHWRDCDADDLECVQHLAATDCSIWNSDDASVAACMLGLGALDGVCGPNACVTDTDCGPATTCVDYVCTPG